MTSPDPVWAAGKPRVVVLGPTEEKLTAQLMEHLGGLFSPRYGTCDGWTPGPGSTDDEVNARINTADAAVLVAGPRTPFDLIEALRDRKGEMVTQVILAREFDTSVTPLARTVEKNRLRPATSYSDVDTFLAEHARSLRGEVQRITAKRLVEAPKPVVPTFQTLEYRPQPGRDLLAEAERNFQAGVNPVDLAHEPAWGSPPAPPSPWGAPVPPAYSPDAGRGAGAPDAEAFASAVMSAFDRAALTQVMHYGLSVNLADVVAPGGIRAQVLELHRWLVNAGRLDQFVQEAARRNPGDPNLAAYARAHRAAGPAAPSWLQSLPPDWSNPDFQRFQEALQASYPDDPSVRAFLGRCGVPTGFVQFTGRSRTTWHDALRSAANQGNMQAVFDRALAENPGAFAAWRSSSSSSGASQVIDRNAVYDRLSKMLPAQLGQVSSKLGIPSAYLPGSTASTSDHAIAIIRWAEQGGQLQRLIDAESTAQRSYP